MGFCRFFYVGTVVVASLLVASCAETQLIVYTAKRITQASTDSSVDTQKQSSGIYKIGNPYQIKGVWYYPKVDYQYDETGIASWYGKQFHKKKTANGEVFDMNELSAAHRTLPLPSAVRVTNLNNGRSLILRVNDRGPFAHGRIIDISRKGAQILGFSRQGTTRVRVQVLPAQSRALGSAIQRGPGRKNVDSPITVAKLPKPSVTAQTLAPPPGGAASPAPQNTPSVLRPTAPVFQPRVASPNWRPTPESVRQSQAKPTKMYIQAGAYGKFENANRVRALLSGFGPVKIMPVLVNGIDYFRVRVGPVSTLEEADSYLDDVIRAGYGDAKIVIDCLASDAKSTSSKLSLKKSRMPISC
jgi:rare lipoprotein A